MATLHQQLEDLASRLGRSTLEQMTRAQLQALATTEGLSSAGTAAVLRDRLTLSERIERHRLKARGYAALPSWAGRSVTRGAYTIGVVTGPELVTLEAITDDDVPYTTYGARFELQFLNTGVDVTPAGYNPWTIVNAPILVEDAAGDIDLGPRGLHRQDLAAALREILLDQARVVFGAA